MAIEKYFPNGSKGHKRGVAWKTIFNQWLMMWYDGIVDGGASQRCWISPP
jgi:hypothetical protein